MFHTVYLSFEDGRVGRDYIGKHSSEDPYDDYLGSYKDKSFDPSGKIILEYAKTEEGAVEAEVRWQKVFKVAEDPQFANQSYQTNKKFVLDTRGKRHPLYGKERNDIKGDKNPAKRPEVSQKISQKLKNRPRPSIQGDNHYTRRTGEGGFKKGDENVAKRLEVRNTISEQKQGENNPAFGRKWWVNADGTIVYQVESPGPEWQNGRKWRG